MNRDNIEEILNSLGNEEIPADLHKIAEDASTDFCRTLAQSRQEREHFLLEHIMRSKLPKLAAAAVIVIAVMLGLSYLDGTSSVVLAEVLERVEQVKAFTYKMKMNMKNIPGVPKDKEMNIDMEAVIAKDVGMRITSHVDGELISETYVAMDEGVIISVMPKTKKYIRMALTGEVFEQMQKENGDPRAMLKEFTSNKHTPLGRSVVDGIEVEGFESTDPNIAANMLGSVLGRIWVDIETKLPVRYDIKVLDKDGQITMDMSVSGFEWDVDVDPDALVVNIPEDYELMADVKMSGDEKGIVEGLSLFAELTDGKYPSELNIMTVVQELRDGIIAKSRGEPDKLDGLEEQEVMQKLMNLQMAGAFYTRMATEGKDPAYYGEKVTAEFPDAVLMRWRLDDGTYKIIFGNLTIGEATAEELDELESAPLNSKPTAIKPQPADGAEGVPITGLKLSWMPGAYVTTHRVYFGTDAEQLTLLGEVTTDYAEPAELQRRATYYWRIDEVQPDGTVATGDTWTFNTARLIGWWKLDDDARDSSGSGNHGTINGDPNSVVGRIGGALEFDGVDDYVETDYATDLPVWTAAIWVKSPAAPSPAASGGPLHRESNFQINWNHSYEDFRGAAALRVGTMWHAATFGELQADTWYHLAATYDGENLKAYKNGVLITDNPDPSGAPDTERGTLKLARHSIYGDHFAGVIDDVRLYSYDLSGDEIAAIFSDPATTLP
ncbi:MAG: hypothetical protein JSU70_05285 [Phycisphaerales bacterium]|nr:MAG: hypothetical protein JSU70_05285 [Phycisphaerales bacterium]